MLLVTSQRAVFSTGVCFNTHLERAKEVKNGLNSEESAEKLDTHIVFNIFKVMCA